MTHARFPGRLHHMRDNRAAALEVALEKMADRLARTEIALLREQILGRQALRRAAEAEARLARLQGKPSSA